MPLPFLSGASASTSLHIIQMGILPGVGSVCLGGRCVVDIGTSGLGS